MKLTQMQYFSAVCRLGNFTRASEHLHISQSAISAAIQQLEQELDTLLLVRGKRSIAPTPSGEEFLRRCNSILAEVEDITADFKNRSASNHTISMGIPPMIGFYLFPILYEKYRLLHPDIRIKLTEAGSDTAKDLVRSGKLEIAIITMGESQPPMLESHILGSTTMLYCVEKNNPLAKKEEVTIQEIAENPLIMFTSGHYHQLVMTNYFHSAGLTPNVLFNSNQLLTIKSFIRRGLAGAMLMPQVIEPDEGIVGLRVSSPITLNVAIIWRKDVFLSREIKQLINFIQQRMEPNSKLI